MLQVSNEIDQAMLTIEQIESDLQNPDSITRKTFLSKGQIIRLYASAFEILSINGKIDVPVNQIANHIMKRTQQLGESISKAWIYDELPTKYKSHRIVDNIENKNIQSIKWTESPSYITPEEENKPEIEFWINQIILCKKVLSHLKSESYLLKKQSDTYCLDKEYHEELIIRKAAQKLVEEAFDNRKTVPISTISLLLDAFITVNNKYAANVYISKLKEYGSQNKDKAMKSFNLFSSKQLTKILKGHVRELHQSFEINTQKEAWENGFYGRCACPECGNWRIILESRYNPNTGTFAEPLLNCFACGKQSTPLKVKLPLSRETPRITEEKVV